MTPDIHTKSMNDRHGMAQTQANMICNTQPSQHKNMTGPNSKMGRHTNANVMQIMGANTNMISGVGVLQNSQPSNPNGNGHSQNNNSQVYTGGNEIESEKRNTYNDEHPNEELMMNIPREGNAEQLNKSTKLTLSSKKQYDTHLQGKVVNTGNNQYL